MSPQRVLVRLDSFLLDEKEALAHDELSVCQKPQPFQHSDRLYFSLQHVFLRRALCQNGGASSAHCDCVLWQVVERSMTRHAIGC